MKRFPSEFDELLSREGRRVLAGTHPLCGRIGRREAKLVYANTLLDRRQVKGALKLIERDFPKRMRLMQDPIPAWTITALEESYKEFLPKAVRVRTDLTTWGDSQIRQQAKANGLYPMMKSASYHAFVQALTGLPLQRRWGQQVLCYLPGDYSGPHNDHHPDEPQAKDGYIDFHITLANDGVKQHDLVYEHLGHLSELVNVNTLGGVTCYRLPFWHYTTPLVAKRGREETAKRWLLLGTFLDQKPRKSRATSAA